MKRRLLLVALSTSPALFAAGCSSDTPTPSCGTVEITSASVTVDYGCDTGRVRTGTIEGRADNCDDELTLEIIDDGETVDDATFEPTDQQFSIGFGEGPDQLRSVPSQGNKTIQIRGPDGDVRAEETLIVSHYLDDPNLDVWDPELDRERVSVSEPVTATFSVATFGGDASFTAVLLIDDERVATREGTVDGGTDCMDASGPTYEFTHSFDEPGTYELSGRITVENASEGGDTRQIGTVTVTE